MDTSSIALSNLLDTVDQSLRVPLEDEQLRVVAFDIPTQVDIRQLVDKIRECEEREKDSWHRIKTTVKDDKLYIRQFMCMPIQGFAPGIASEITSELAAAGRDERLGLMHLGRSIFMDTQGRRAKQADNCILPFARKAHRQTGVDYWPSVVVDVGYKETLSELHQHADDWMVMSASSALPRTSRVKLVILVKLYPETKKMGLKLLQRGPAPPHHAILVPNLGPFEWDADSTQDDENTSIEIPLDLIYDEIPAHFSEAGRSTVTIRLQSWVQDALGEW
ncbi:hypothetical protein MKEN_00134300 [Mycena kentingensis (nom. inval.)]|nr:hypothetical protein MKEN_00134300 [Mycena kentingensis (nom. inval.)]